MRRLIRSAAGLVVGRDPAMATASTGDIRFEAQGRLDRMVGPDFEAGLANLKTLAERH
jgi:hypothetical protein